MDKAQKEKLSAHWDAAVTAFRSVTAKKLRSIRDLASAVRTTRKNAKEIAEHLDGLLAALLENNVDSAVAEAKGLMAVTTELADIVDYHLSCRYAEAMSAALKGSEELLAKHGVEVRPEFNVDSPAKVRILDHELTAILQDLMRNAVEAMQDSENREITIRASESARVVRVDVIDSGVGLRTADPESVFDRGATTKPLGSGFGLYYARRTLRRYRGDVNLASREDGQGAVASVVMRRAKDA
jgi:signal transduction histidine kinase